MTGYLGATVLLKPRMTLEVAVDHPLGRVTDCLPHLGPDSGTLSADCVVAGSG